MALSLRCNRPAKALTAAFLLLFQRAADAALSGTVVVPMGGSNLPPIEVSFLHNEGEEVDIYTVQSHGLEGGDEGFFKVEGPLSCVRFISDNQVIVSGVAMGTAMNHRNFVRVGDTVVLAVTNTQVSVISRIPSGQDGDCLDPDWDDFMLLDVTEGSIDIDLLG